MSRFQRRLALPLGVALVALGAAGLLFAGETDWWTTVAAVLFLPAGIAYLCSSRLDRVRLAGRTVRWQQLTGIGTILLGAAWLLTTVPMARPSLPMGVLMGLGALGLVFIGVQELTDGPHVDLEGEPSRTRLAAVSLLVVVSVALGVAIVL